MEVSINTPIVATLPDPAGGAHDFGARVEVPITREIVSYWRPATLTGLEWSVELDPVVESGEYLLVWLNSYDPPDHEIFVPLTALALAQFADSDIPAVDTAAVTPTVDDVANLEKTRLVTGGSAQLATFTQDTNPSIAEVQDLISQAVPLVLSEFPVKFPITYYDSVRHAVALYVAVLIEGSHFREQENSESTNTWRTLYNSTVRTTNQNIEKDLAQWRLLRRIEIPQDEWVGAPVGQG